MEFEPAFPCEWSKVHHTPGMSLRDYFAAKAMQSLIQIVKNCALGKDGLTILPDSIRLSNVAYGMADAMMRAREEV